MKLVKLFLFGATLFASLSFSQVNINTATAEELAALPNIGEVKANAIIKYRRANGKFKSVDELMNVNGIGEKTVKGLGRNAKTTGRTDLSKLTKVKKATKKKTPTKAKSKTSKTTSSQKTAASKTKSKTKKSTSKTQKSKAKKVASKKSKAKKSSKKTTTKMKKKTSKKDKQKK